MKILIPFHGRNHPENAFRTALSYGKKAELLLLHVTDETAVNIVRSKSGFLSDRGEVITTLKQRVKESQQEEAKKFVEKAQKETKKRGMTLDILYRTGNPTKEILDVARQTKVDLIIMERLRGKTVHVFFGSVAKYVSKYAPCKVLIETGTKQDV